MSEGRTIRARRLKDGTLVEELPDGSTRPFPPDDTDWAGLRRMTEEEINAAALTDPDNPPRTPEREKHLKRVPQVKVMRPRDASDAGGVRGPLPHPARHAA